MLNIFTVESRIVQRGPRQVAAGMVAFSSETVLLTLLKVAQQRLTSKQKLILNSLRFIKTKRSVTKVVPILARELNCSLSAIWFSLNQLKRSQLVEFSSANNKGLPVRLTPLGKWLARNLKNGFEADKKNVK